MLDINNTKAIKVLFAFWIIVGHLMLKTIVSAYIYFPVAGFFFLSGYGLMKMRIINKEFKLFKNIKKILLPYYLCLFIYLLLFIIPNFVKPYGPLEILKDITLIRVILPFGWYVRAQIILYLIWSFCLKIKNEKVSLIFVFLGLFLYCFIFKYTGQILTSYKSVFAFGFGVIYAYCEPKICKYTKSYVVAGIGGLLACALRLLVHDESILSAILINVSSVIFCLVIIYLLYTVRFDKYIPKIFTKCSYEFYLVQGISQCILFKTYYCDVSYLELKNTAIIIPLSICLTILLGIIIKIVEDGIEISAKKFGKVFT